MRKMLCLGLFLLVIHFGLVAAQTRFWDAPTQGRGSTHAEVIRMVTSARSEVFLVTPALYSGLGQALREGAARGVEVRVVLGAAGVPVSTGAAALRGTKAEIRYSPTSPQDALLIVDRKTLVRGPAVWNPRGQGFLWVSLPPNAGNNLLDSLRYLWQAAKPL